MLLLFLVLFLLVAVVVGAAAPATVVVVVVVVVGAVVAVVVEVVVAIVIVLLLLVFLWVWGVIGDLILYFFENVTWMYLVLLVYARWSYRRRVRSLLLCACYTCDVTRLLLYFAIYTGVFISRLCRNNCSIICSISYYDMRMTTFPIMCSLAIDRVLAANSTDCRFDKR